MKRDTNLMSPLEAARVLGVTTRTIRRYADKGKLEAVHTPLGRVLSTESVLAESSRRIRAGRT